MKKTLAIAVASLSLIACSSDDNNSSSSELDQSILDATLEQNDLLREQLARGDDAENSETSTANHSATLTLIDFVSGETINDATVEIYFGIEKVSEVSAINGSILIEDLEPNTEYSFVIKAADTTYIDKLVAFTTINTLSANLDLGIIALSKAAEYTFKVVDSESNTAIDGLSFRYNAYISGNGTTLYEDYVLGSTFNTETGEYEIILPEGVDARISSSIDIDGDKNADFALAGNNVDGVELWGTILYIDVGTSTTVSEIVLNELEDEPTVQFNISLINDAAEQLTTATLSGEFVDADNQIQWTEATLNTESSQYEITVSFDRNSDSYIYFPAFSVGDELYSSGQIRLSVEDEDEFGERAIDVRLSTPGCCSDSYDVILDDDINLVFEINALENTNEAEVVVFNVDAESPEDTKVTLFFSDPVSVDNGSFTFTQNGTVINEIIYGNASDSDSIAPGVTRVVTVTNPDVDFDVTTDLNDTRVIVEPSNSLTEGSYFVRLDSYTTLSSDVETTLSSYSYNESFEVEQPGTPSFDPDNFVLDNANYTTQGNSIVPANTAGVTSSNSDRPSTAYLYIPLDKLKGESLKVYPISIVEDGNPESTNNRTLTLIYNGQINGSLVTAISVASNEFVDSCCVSLVAGTTLEHGRKYVRSSSIFYTSDHIQNDSTEQNQATFFYEYQATEDSDVETGEFTLTVN